MPHLRPGFLIREAIENDARSTQIELLLSQGLAPQLSSRFQNIDEYSSRLKALRAQTAKPENRDPIVTARQLSARLRELDRATQLAEFRPLANQLLQKFQQEVQSISPQLDRFKLSVSIGSGGDPSFGSDVDEIAGPVNVIVQVNHHNKSRRRAYKVASRGEQCVVCAYNFIAGVKPSYDDWTEIAWYEGSPDDVLPTLKNEFNVWLDVSLGELAAEVLNS